MLNGIGRYRTRGPQKRKVSHPVAANTKLWRNQHLALSGGYAIPWPASGLGLVSGGIAIETVDNLGGAAGPKRVEAEAIAFLFNNAAGADALSVADVGAVAYGGNEETACKTNGGGTRSPIGHVVEVILPNDPRVVLGEEPGVYVDVGDVSSGVHRLPIIIERTFTHEDLDAAAPLQALSFGAPLPAGARLRTAGFPALGEAFAGGGATAVTVQLGTASNAAAVVQAVNVFTGASGFPRPGTAGALGYAGAPLGGAQLQVLFTVTGANAGALTSGSVTVRAEIVID